MRRGEGRPWATGLASMVTGAVQRAACALRRVELARVRRAVAHLALAALLPALGCVADVEAVRLPVTADAPYVLVVAYGPGTQVRAEAHTRPTSGPAELSVPLDTDELYAADFACGLDTLGFELPIEVATDGAPLPTPNLLRVLDPAGPVRWRSVTELDTTRLEALRLRARPEATACAAIDDEPLADAPADWVLSAGDGRALIGGPSGVRAIDDTLHEDVLRDLRAPVLGAFVDTAGTIHLASARSLARGTLTGGFERTPLALCDETPCSIGRVWIDGTSTADTLDLLALTEGGVLLHLTGGARTELARSDAPVSRGAVVRIADGALVLGLAGDRLKRVRGEAVEDVAAPLDRATALAKVELGAGASAVVAATPSGEIYQLTGALGGGGAEAWTRLASAGGSSIDALTVAGGTLIVTRATTGTAEARGDGVECAGAGRKATTAGLVALDGTRALRVTRSLSETTGALSVVSVTRARLTCATGR